MTNNEVKKYKYYMNERPLSPGAQPRGFSRFDENDHGGRWGAIYYPKELTAQEISRYELTPSQE